MADYKIGEGKKAEGNKGYADLELGFAKKQHYLEFFHIPTANSVQFKAILTEFADNYESNWASEEAYGRNDPIENFVGTKRKISIGWKVASASLEEAKDNLRKAEMLMSMLYPVYDKSKGNNASSIVAAPLFKFTFANLVRDYGAGGTTEGGNSGKAEGGSGAKAKDVGLVGRVGGFQYNPDLDQGMFDPSPGKLYPQTIVLSCEFTVIHTSPLGWSRTKKKRTPLFPYGERDPDGTPTKDVKKSGKSSGTDAQKSARANKVLK